MSGEIASRGGYIASRCGDTVQTSVSWTDGPMAAMGSACLTFSRVSGLRNDVDNARERACNVQVRRRIDMLAVRRTVRTRQHQDTK